MSTILEHPYPERTTMQDVRMDNTYGDIETLGADWKAKQKATEGAEFLPDGARNPHHPRLLIETDIARMMYDISYLLHQNRNLSNQVAMLSDMHQRMGILEGAYGHLMAMAQSVKLEYYNKLKKLTQPKGQDNEA